MCVAAAAEAALCVAAVADAAGYSTAGASDSKALPDIELRQEPLRLFPDRSRSASLENLPTQQVQHVQQQETHVSSK